MDAYKEKLEKELALLTKELQNVGRPNPNTPGDWEPRPQEVGAEEADPNDAADRIEGLTENAAILKDLEIRYNNVKRALEKISNGTFGTCEIGGEKIEEDRLEANPAARTCKAHMEEEGGLSI